MYVSGIRSHGGESSERKIAMPRLIGTPNRRASADVTRVPYTNGTDPARSVLLPAWIVDTPPQEVDQRLRLRLGHRRPDRVQLLVDQQVRETGNRIAVRARRVEDRDVVPVPARSREARDRGRRCGRTRQARQDKVARWVSDFPDLQD